MIARGLSHDAPERPGRRAALGGGAPGLMLAAVLLYLVLLLPNHPAALAPDMLLVFPLEWPVLMLALLLMPARGAWARTGRVAVVVWLGGITLLKCADFATFVTYARGFNPLVDMHLLIAAWHLGSGAVGAPLARAVALAALVTVVALLGGLWWATGRVMRVSLPAGGRRAAGIAVVPLCVLAVVEIGAAMRAWNLPAPVPGAAFTARVTLERAEMLGETFARLRAFRTAAETDPFAGAAPLLDRIGGRDVLFLYVESYGAANLTNPRYAPTHRETLAGIETDLAARGLAMRSGWLEAPTLGGQSWLSHATLARGLWIPDQRTYGAALLSGRRSLFHVARDHGFESVAVMPAITMDWPEAAFMGFDRILAAGDLGYEGLPFNWVTMPDQFTLAALDRLVRQGAAGQDRRPVFAQVALISSHAPWTPVPDLVPWEALGDGRIFDAVAQSCDPPEVVWRDRDRVRDQFRKAVDYSLRAAGAYAARQAGDPPLMIVLGDHPPAQFVSEAEERAVPIHVIGPDDLVSRFEGWGWREGMVPDTALPPLRMDAFRNRFLSTFSSAEAARLSP